MSSQAGLGLAGLPAERKEYSAPVFSTLPKVNPKKARWVIILSHWSKLLEGLQVSPLEFYACVEETIHRREIPLAKNCRVEWQEGGILSAHREYLRIVRGEHAIDICGAPFGTGFFVSYWFVRNFSPLGLITLLVIFSFMVTTAIMLVGVPVLLLGQTTGLLSGDLIGQTAGDVLALAMFVVAVPLVLFLMIRYLNHNRPGWDFHLMTFPGFGRIYTALFRPFTYYKIDTALMFHRAVHDSVIEVIDGMTKAKGVRPLTELERKPVMREFLESKGSKMDQGNGW